MLEKVDDISRIHNYTIDPRDNPMAISTFIIILLLLIPMLLSIRCLYIQKFKPNLDFFSNDFWILFIIGTCLILCSPLMEIGKLYVFNCHLKIILLTVGFSMSMIPVLYKLVINFPEKNRISIWISKNRYKFLLFFISIDILLNSLSFVKPINISIITIYEKKYYFCELRNDFGIVIETIMIIYRIIITLTIIILIFLEWNLSTSKYIIKYLASALTIDMLCFIILFSIRFSKSKKDNFVPYNLLYVIIVVIYSATNFTFIYAINIIRSFMKQPNEEDEISVRNIRYYPSIKRSVMSTKEPSLSTHESKSSSRIATAIQKLTDYHYRTSSDTPSSYSINSYASTNYSYNHKVPTTLKNISTKNSSSNIVNFANMNFNNIDININKNTDSSDSDSSHSLDNSSDI